jgi:hypothetical protein
MREASTWVPTWVGGDPLLAPPGAMMLPATKRQRVSAYITPSPEPATGAARYGVIAGAVQPPPLPPTSSGAAPPPPRQRGGYASSTLSTSEEEPAHNRLPKYPPTRGDEHGDAIPRPQGCPFQALSAVCAF